MLAEIFLLRLEHRLRMSEAARPKRDPRFVPIVIKRA